MPLIAGFGLAAELAAKQSAQREAACRVIRTQALAALAPLGSRILSAEEGKTLPHILSFAVPGVDSEALMVALKDLVAISNGSACTSNKYAPSHVLTAMHLSNDELAGAIRLSWSHVTPPIPWVAIAKRIDDLRF